MKANQAYQIFNIRTGEFMGSRSSRKLAQRYADKLDLQYGAINYAVKQNYDDKPEGVR
jgi:hypothetical protein